MRFTDRGYRVAGALGAVAFCALVWTSIAVSVWAATR